MPDLLSLIVLVAVFAGLMWLMGAPQRRMRKEQAAMLAQLAPGTEVMTHGGLYGTVLEVEDDVVLLETSPGVTMRWATRAIARVVEPVAVADEELADEEYADEEYDDELADDELADDELADETADDELADEELADDETVAEGADDWTDVEVPDDASSLTTPDDEDKPGR